MALQTANFLKIISIGIGAKALIILCFYESVSVDHFCDKLFILCLCLKCYCYVSVLILGACRESGHLLMTVYIELSAPVVSKLVRRYIYTK